MALTVTRVVRPSPVWQESYVRVKKGQRMVIDADGPWSPDARNRTVWCGADGIPSDALKWLSSHTGILHLLFTIMLQHGVLTDDCFYYTENLIPSNIDCVHYCLYVLCLIDN